MQERKTFIYKAKQLYSQKEKAISIMVLVIIAIVLFISGYFFAWNCLEKPMNNNQFASCELIAQEIYSQKRNVIVENPWEFSISTTTTTITVRSSNVLYRGKIVAELKNGKLVTTRKYETAEAIGISMFVGILFILIPIDIFILIIAIPILCKRIKNRDW